MASMQGEFLKIAAAHIVRREMAKQAAQPSIKEILMQLVKKPKPRPVIGGGSVAAVTIPGLIAALALGAMNMAARETESARRYGTVTGRLGL